MVSVVMVTYNRAHLLARSLELYHSQSHSDIELIVVDDDSNDDTQDLLKHWAKKMRIVSLIVRKDESGKWRDCAVNINLGLRAAKGEYVIGTHPEVIPGKESIAQLWANRKDWQYDGCKIYYLSPFEQENIDSVDWKSNPLAVRDIPGFYQSEPAYNMNDYTHEAMDGHQEWGSWVFGGMTRKTWQDIGGFTEFEMWGSIDVDFLNRRNILGIKTATPMDERAICIHQNHDVPGNVPSPRDMGLCMRSLPTYPNRESAIRKNM